MPLTDLEMGLVREWQRNHMEGKWSEDDLRGAFIAGAMWWEFFTTGITEWTAQRREAEQEAERRYPDGHLIGDRARQDSRGRVT